MTEAQNLIAARLPRGFDDRAGAEIARQSRMLDTITRIYELYGFDPIETPFLEYTEALGKFLPDTDRPNAGVFSLVDDDEHWLSLRYDLTAPLARYFAQHYDRLPKPFRSYRQGYVFRNEKPGPGRFRQFMQFDADIVGAAGPEADAEIAMMMADTMEALGLAGRYRVKINNRQVLDGVLAQAGVIEAGQKLAVLRAIDKLDKFGLRGVEELLGEGRRDESGDFTAGAGLGLNQRGVVLSYLNGAPPAENPGVSDLAAMQTLFDAGGYGRERLVVDPAVVRGLDYYTGAVFEIELTFAVPNEKGQPVVFGSVGGGGRYDGLVSRFRAEPVPATGFSIGVSRLAEALRLAGTFAAEPVQGPVVVLVLDRDPVALADYQAMAREIRNAGIRAEMYLGSSGMNAQMKYADRRNAPAAIIVGSNERAAGEVTIKDLAAGAEAAKHIADNAAYKAMKPGQMSVKRSELVAALATLPALARRRG